MNTITISELQRDPKATFNRIAAGESFLIRDGANTVAELRPIVVPVSTERPIGLCAGEFTVPDDFDAPLSDDVLRELKPLEAPSGYPRLSLVHHERCKTATAVRNGDSRPRE